jgi:hypothetical protein
MRRNELECKHFEEILIRLPGYNLTESDLNQPNVLEENAASIFRVVEMSSKKRELSKNPAFLVLFTNRNNSS